MYFEIVGPVTNIEPIAAGSGVRKRSRLHREYGRARWRKLKGRPWSESPAANCVVPRFTGMKRMESGVRLKIKRFVD
jgi:hypothetical protein